MLQLILFLSFVSVISFFFFCTTSHPRTRTPSPESYPLIGNLPGFLRNRHRFHDWVTDMLVNTPSSTLQVNSFLNISRGICTANPVNVEHLLVTNFSNYVKGSRFLNVLYELLGHGIFNVDGHLWIMQRKIASHEFNTKSLKHFISDVVKSEMTRTLMPYLVKACEDDAVFDLQQVLGKFTFTTICEVAFGVDPESSMPNLPFAKAFDDAVAICFFSRFLSPFPPVWKLKRLLNLGSEKRLKEAIGTIEKFVLEIIKSKNQEKDSDKSQDLLSRFMFLSSDYEFQDQEQKTKFLRDIVISFVLAGKDTTSTALAWFFWLLVGNPRCGRLIYEELTEVAPPEAVSESRMRIFSYDDLKKLHYLHAALSETMRLFPPVAINSRLTVDDDVLPDGTRVGKGWFADYSAYAMGRMEKVWGQDCREFKPERWLDKDGKFQPSDQFRFPVFHCGPRTCLGKELAYIQMKAIAAAVMYEFEILAIDGGANAERMMNPPYIVTLLLKMRGGFSVRLKRREREGPGSKLV
ncbi:cytochrome P450, putative [Ricinus communis]|uniref:Cytochrome P450, putative n=1 Tax=Ricinus communis TaxID=3988 RepID=B9SM19_RICCO|nr:cytochrome P450, putative [Ricinus communis]|eukprot:XP_002527038.1 cytochrome P450 94A1 [Ricinus communis]